LNEVLRLFSQEFLGGDENRRLRVIKPEVKGRGIPVGKFCCHFDNAFHFVEDIWILGHSVLVYVKPGHHHVYLILCCVLDIFPGHGRAHEPHKLPELFFVQFFAIALITLREEVLQYFFHVTLSDAVL